MGDSRWTRLVQDLESDNVDVAVRASEELSELADETNVSELYSLLENDDFFIREAAAFPLARLDGVRALPALFRAYTRGFQDGYDNDGMTAAIGDLLESCQRAALPLLEKMLLDQDKEVRANSAWALGFVTEQTSPNVLLNLLEIEGDPDVRLAAIGSLANFNGSTQVVEKLLSLLGDASEKILIGVIDSLGYLGDKKALTPLKEILQKRSSQRVHESAKSAMKRIRAKNRWKFSLFGH
jgi:HEAT repeat protein